MIENPDTFSSFSPKMRIASALLLFFLIQSTDPSTADAGAKSGPVPLSVKFATVAPSNGPWGYVSEMLLNPLAHEIFGDNFRSTLYQGGVMGDDYDILRKMNLDQLQGCACSLQGTIRAVPELSVLTLPLLFESYDEVDYIMQKLRKYIESAFEKQGYYLLSIVDFGFINFFSREDPSILQNLRKQKVNSWSGEIMEQTFRTIGISPIMISVSDAIPAISSGMIEAGATSPTWVLATQTYGYFNYYLDPPLFYGPAMVFIKKDALDRIIRHLEENPETFRGFQNTFRYFQGKNLQPDSYIREMGITDEHIQAAARTLLPWLQQQKMDAPQDFKNIFLGIFRQVEKPWAQSVRDFEAGCFREFTRRGMKKAVLSNTDLTKLRLITRPVWDEFVGKLYPRELLDGIRNRLIEYRAAKSQKTEN